MIPKRAFFIWGGPEMPWVRRVCVDSFRLLNPAWSVEVLPVDGDTRHDVIQNSDILSYGELSRNGGVYFDTDILFTRPIDGFMEQVGDCDTVVCFETIKPRAGVRLDVLKDDGTIVKGGVKSIFYSVASLMSSPGNDFFRAAETHATSNRGHEDYQACGIWTLLERFTSISDAAKEFPDLRFFNVPRRAFLPIPFDRPRELFRQDRSLYDALADDAEVYGIHWYGGSEVGRLADKWGEDTYWKDCPLGDGISRVLSLGGGR